MATVESKSCSRCKQILPATLFTRDQRTASGLQPACKRCCAAAQKTRRQADPEASRLYARDYAKRNPDKVKKWSETNRQRNADAMNARQREYYRKNREKAIEWVRQNRKDNPERLREWARGWQAKRKALKAGGMSGAETRAWMLAQAKICHWCGKRCAKDFHIDHIVPLSKGGGHEPRNLCISCPPCNLRKSAKDPFDFAREIGKLL